MNQIVEYKIEDNSWESLKKIGFRNIGEGIYIYNFPCYKWNGFVTITGRFTSYDDTKNITVDVYQEDGRPYSPFYHNEKSEVMAIIRSNISKECNKCGITRTFND